MGKEPKKIILIIEDDSPIRMAYLEKLKREGYNVIEAVDGPHGLELAKKENPDLVLLDILLPYMDGIDLLKQMRGSDWGKQIKVLVLSNLSDPFKEAEAARHLVEDYIIKSDTSLEDVIEKIRNIIGPARDEE